MRWIVGSAPHGAWLGILERDKLTPFVARLTSGMTVWDIGANVGLYTLPSARAVGPTGHVVAFEPMPRNLGFLRRHLTLNGLDDVLVCDVAVSDATGALRMAEGDSPSEFHADTGGSFEVKAVTLDDWLAESGAPPARPGQDRRRGKRRCGASRRSSDLHHVPSVDLRCPAR